MGCSASVDSREAWWARSVTCDGAAFVCVHFCCVESETQELGRPGATYAMLIADGDGATPIVTRCASMPASARTIPGRTRSRRMEEDEKEDEHEH